MTQIKSKTGTLFLIPTTLGPLDSSSQVLPEYNKQIIGQIKHFVVEQVRTARRFLRHIDHPVAIDDMQFFELNKHTNPAQIGHYLLPLKEGYSMGLISEAGTPCVADPGSMVVALAHQAGIKVVPLVGPNSLIMALMASGFNGQHFLFHGYLPREKSHLTRKIREMETAAARQHQTQLFIETPFRNNALLDTLLQVCQPRTLLCLATDISLPEESIVTKTVGEWKKNRPDMNKRPTVFLLYY